MDFLTNEKKAPETPFVSAVIAAAGHSTRMGGGVNKQFLPLCGVPVLVRTVAAFEKSSLVSEIIIVAAPAETAKVEALIKNSGMEKPVRIVAGGDTRQESAAVGFEALSDVSAFVAVHDGARPLVSVSLIDSVLLQAFSCGAAAAAVPVKDTIKVASKDGFIEKTPDRSKLFAVQTPQVFAVPLYRRALEKARKTGESFTDDCGLVENIGVHVRLVTGEYSNLKITTPEDVPFAEAILRRRGIL